MYFVCSLRNFTAMLSLMQEITVNECLTDMHICAKLRYMNISQHNNIATQQTVPRGTREEGMRKVNYISKHKLKTCDRCGKSNLLWVENKNGKWYLCDTIQSRGEVKSMHDVRYAAPWLAHNCAEWLKLVDSLADERKRDNAELQTAINKLKGLKCTYQQ